MLGVGGGGGGFHPLQLTTGLVINSSVTTSPTLAGEHMLLIPKVSILSEQIKGVTRQPKIYIVGEKSNSIYNFFFPLGQRGNVETSASCISTYEWSKNRS